MRAAYALIGSMAIAASLLLSAAPAAGAEMSATEPNPRTPAASIVTGETWSGPSAPVTCTDAARQISCTPDDPAAAKPQECYLGVLYAGSRATVCTTFDGHGAQIQAAGGKKVLVEYGCSLGDAVCLSFENAGRGLALSATTAMHLVASNMRFDTTTLLWDAATHEWSFWQWAVLIVVFASMVWAVGAAVVSGDREQLIGAMVRTFIAIPAVPITLWISGHLLNAIDDMTWYILNRDGPFELFATMQGVMWAGGQANYFFAFIIHGLILVAMLLLALVFAFRNVVLAALFAVGPIAWMLFPLRGVGPQWVVRYVSAVVALLLTGPITVGFVTLIVNGLANVETIWDPQSWPLLVGLALVAFAPFAVFGLFSFVGAVAADGVGSRLGTSASRMASGAARSAMRIPSRLGALPAGRTSSRGGSARPSTRTSGTSGSSMPGGRPAHSAPARADAPTRSARTATSTPSPTPTSTHTSERRGN